AASISLYTDSRQKWPEVFGSGKDLQWNVCEHPEKNSGTANVKPAITSICTHLCTAWMIKNRKIREKNRENFKFRSSLHNLPTSATISWARRSGHAGTITCASNA